MFVNEELKAYHKLWEFLDTFVFLDARPANAYKWREEQEAALRAQGRGAMTREEVRGFVDAYFPAYELYLRGLRDGDRIQTLMKPGGCGARAEEEGDRRGTLLRVLIDGRREVVGEEWNNWSGPTNATGEWDGDGKGVDREE